MPWPASVSERPGAVPITAKFTISVAGAGAADPRLREAIPRIYARLARQTGIPILPHAVSPDASPTLALVVEQRDHAAPQRLGDDERYSLEVSNEQIRISADQPLGALRGIETFLELVQQDAAVAGQAPGFSVPALVIHDEPRFAWRGLSLDVSRHFIPVDEVKRTIDGLSAVKLNVLHWHLSDDQGFRVESKKFPRLAQYGSDGLYYTQTEIREVVTYARNRGVRIVPEFDMPGHATSWLPGYPALGAGSGPYEIFHTYGGSPDLLDPTKESIYRFLDGFIGEMAKLFPDEYFHIGGDEVEAKQWNANPRVEAFMRKHHLDNAKSLQAYFNARLLKIVTKHHKHMLGWDEILEPDLPKTIVIEAWRNAKPLADASREGFQSILSAGYYLDLMRPASQHYAVDPLKGAGADLTPEQTKLILGGEAAMWEELATTENLDSRLWPRLAAIAERFWSPESVTDVSSMYRRLEETDRWLEWLGLTQRSNLELMRQRLAGPMPYEPLDRFAAILEPVKGYARHADRYTTSTPLNRLVDAIPPESMAAREFGDLVDRYLANRDTESAKAVEDQLIRWRDVAREVRPMLEANSLLVENVPAAEALTDLCEVGQEALSAPVSTERKQRLLSRVQAAAERKGDILIAIAPAIQKLVEAVPVAR